MNQSTRLILAFLIAPTVPIGLFSAFYFGTGRFLPLLPFATTVGYFITIVVAMPIYMFMAKKGWLRWWHFSFVGAIPALSLDAFLFLMSISGVGDGSKQMRHGGVDLIVNHHGTHADYLHESRRLLLIALTGAVAGFVFWCIAHAGSNQTLKADAPKDGARERRRWH